MSKHFLTLMALLAVTMTACEPATVYYPNMYDRSVVSLPEIQNVRAESALDLIRKTRPNFLISRGMTTVLGVPASSYPTVYLDGMRYGSINLLQDIPASSIAEIRLYTAAQSAQFGVGNVGGVLMIRTRRN
jgi:outer membrane cobalamin receptor